MRFLAGPAALFLRLGRRLARLARAGGRAQAQQAARERAERSAAALSESEARFRAMADHIPQLAWMARPDGWIVWYNKRWHQYTGTAPEETEGWGWRAVHHPDHVGRAEAGFRRCIATGKPWEDTFPLRGKDGAFRWFLSRAEPIHDEAGRITLWFGTNTDVTEQRAAETALRENEERLRLLVEGVADHALIMLDPKGHIASWNSGAERIEGWPAAEVLGQPHAVFFTAEDRAAGVPAAALDEARRNGVWRGEGTRVRRDGSTFLANTTLTALRDENGRLRGFAKIARDVTERRRAEELRSLLMREVDHRAKNVLAVALSLLRMTPRNDAAAFAASVEGRVAAMARAHSLLAERRWEGADLHDLAAGELKAHGVALVGPPVRLTPEAVQPVAMLLHELATNATKHGALGQEEGSVVLTWAFEGDGRLRLRWEERGGPLVQGPPARLGFGSRLIAALAGQQLGGSVACDWAEAGLACTILLAARVAAPARGAEARPEQAPLAAPEPEKAQACSNAPRPRVLVVEDEALLAMELEGSLDALGCEVVGPAQTLADAFRLAIAEPRPSAAVLDVNLGGGEMSFPVMDLLETRGVPFIVATGYEDSRSLQGRAASAVAVLRKPYGQQELASALAAALRRCTGAASACPEP